ncbi:MAG TPA: TerB family tellurite resistance protein [Myxococcota bacterium]|jgi:uncharacterized tellurite resistance protein B-like protein|nr:TerB family tellurite resistance protein [Myxococcota bacterium]
MSLWRRIFPSASPNGDDDGSGDTESVRRIAARLAKLPPEDARFLAAFAYVMARLANADLEIDETESREMERLVAETAGLDAEEAALAVEIAKSQTRLLGGTENYVVTREFRRVSSPSERARLVECLYAVAAADRWITNVETTEIAAIADELGLAREELAAVRSRYRDKIAALRPR